MIDDADDRADTFKRIDRALRDALYVLTGEAGEIEAGFWNKTMEHVECAIELLESLMEDE